MTTETAVLFEFRCSRCFHTQYASADQSGTNIACTNCQQQTVVPEATPDRIARAANVNPESLQRPSADRGTTSKRSMAQTTTTSDKAWTDADFEREVQRQMAVDFSEIQNISSFAASRLKRFGGQMVDSLLLVLAYTCGGVAFIYLVGAGFLPEEVFDEEGSATALQKFSALAIIYFPPLALSLIQWNMIACDGKSIGKKLLKMTIVRADGGKPGFLQGVVLRNWLRAALNLIPFFGLADSLSIFGQSKRCLHDFMAGTHVLDDQVNARR